MSSDFLFIFSLSQLVGSSLIRTQKKKNHTEWCGFFLRKSD